MDWEYLSNDGVNYGRDENGHVNIAHPDDCENFALFVELLRNYFNERGWNGYTIAMCCTAAPEKMKFDVGRLVPLLDEWHVMTYEYNPPSLKLTVVLHQEHGPILQRISRICIRRHLVRILLVVPWMHTFLAVFQHPKFSLACRCIRVDFLGRTAWGRLRLETQPITIFQKRWELLPIRITLVLEQTKCGMIKLRPDILTMQLKES